MSAFPLPPSKLRVWCRFAAAMVCLAPEPAIGIVSPAADLSAGPIRLRFADGELRDLYVGKKEIARRIYFAVRDAAWATVPAKFTRAQVRQQDDGFTIQLEAECKSATTEYTWTATITGTAAGEISFEAEGSAPRDLRSRRIGLCLLFGADSLAGQTFELDDGRTGEFPHLVAPKLLAEKFSELRYATADHLAVTARIDGAHFWMEDQRNFGDSSYKAFAPLDYPWPEVPADTPRSQRLTLTVLGAGQPEPGPEIPRVRCGATIAGAKVPRVTETSLDAENAPDFLALNTKRASHAEASALAFRFNPTTHLRDDDTLMENVSAVRDQALTVHSFAPRAAIRVAPLTFHPHEAGALPDSREETGFGAAWSAAVLKQLALGGVEEAAFAIGGKPARDVQRRIGAHAGATLIETQVEAAGRSTVEAWAIEHGGQRLLWLIHLRKDLQEVEVEGLRGRLLLGPWEVREVTLPAP